MSKSLETVTQPKGRVSALERLLDYVTAVGIAALLCILAMAYFDVLVY